MKWFTNLQTGNKLSLSFGVLILILGIVIIQSLFNMLNLFKLTEELYQKQLNLTQIVTEIDDNNNLIQSTLLSVMLQRNLEQSQKTINKTFENQGNRLHEIMKVFQDDPIISHKLETISNLRDHANNVKDEQLMPALTSDNMDLAKKILFGSYIESFDRMSDIVDELKKDANDRAQQAVVIAKEQVTRSIVYFVIISILAIIISIFMVFMLNRLIAVPINELSKLSKKIANKELIMPQNLDTERTDEVGILNKSFEVMIKNLRELTEELTGIITFLSSTSNEISSASTELASTAAETATSINETTSTIEEVKQTSQMTNNKAKLVSEATQRSTHMSESGKKAAFEINDAINEIHNQMNLIGATMMRLNEQTQTVGTIISSVEDLTQQTNLLAVNASIEASKAGDQGKGFSVVAQEVKSLAVQSKQATSQVRTILNDIQKATSAAVMATEMGSKAVETGVQKTDEAQESILKLIGTITENSQAASQIAAVSSQQLVGMEQATMAMESIKQASNQNLESAKFLSDSITNIKDLSMKLKQMVSQFKIK